VIERKNKPKIVWSTKSKKINIYRSERMTCGTHEAAASSTIPRRQGIKRKKGNIQKLIRGSK
jgi:hypothetical protein